MSQLECIELRKTKMFGYYSCVCFLNDSSSQVYEPRTNTIKVIGGKSLRTNLRFTLLISQRLMYLANLAYRVVVLRR